MEAPREDGVAEAQDRGALLMPHEGGRADFVPGDVVYSDRYHQSFTHRVLCGSDHHGGIVKEILADDGGILVRHTFCCNVGTVFYTLAAARSRWKVISPTAWARLLGDDE